MCFTMLALRPLKPSRQRVTRPIALSRLQERRAVPSAGPGHSYGASVLAGELERDQAGTSDNPIDPLLGALARNGGPTKTMALLAGSLAIDAGDNTAIDPITGQMLTTDQRGTGFPRQKDGNGDHIKGVDIGAFEKQPLNRWG